MDTQVLVQGLKNQLPAVEGFLNTILLKKINVEVSATSVADAEMVVEALKTGTAVVSVKDQIFNTSVFIAFDDNWIPQLSTAMLGVEENEVNEITRDLIKEFTSQLFGTVQVSLQADDVPVEPGPVEILKSAQITSGVTGTDYFIAQVDVTGKFTIDGDEQPQLAMIVAFEIPDEDIINEIMGTTSEETAPEAPSVTEDDDELISDENIEALLAEAAPTSKVETKEKSKTKSSDKKDKEREKARELPPVSSRPVEFEDFNPFSDVKSEVEVRNLDILKEVELDISVELGRKELPLGDVLHLVRGSVIELDKLAGEPVEIYANGHRIAEGEVVVIDEHFGVRITNLISTKERIESLR